MTKCLRFVFASFVAITTHFMANAQSVSINTTGATANASSILDVTSTNKGILIPRLSKAQKNAIAAPATGLLIFQDTPDSIGFYFFNGTSWLWLDTASAGGPGWLINGNTGTDTAVNFLGTLDNKPLMLRQNNLWMGQLNTRRHNYFIGGGSGQNNDANQNTGMGDSALFANTTGVGNVAMGYRAMRGGATTTGNVNVAIGNNALSAVSTGGQNVAIGDGAAGSLQTGGTNVIVGPGAMESATRGNDNIGLGLWALRLNDTASNNIAIGNSTLYVSKHNNNVAIGFNSGTYVDNDPNIYPTNRVTYVGPEAGYAYWTGSKSVGLGYRALYNYESATNTIWGSAIGRNTAIGDSAMGLTYGSRNVAIGTEALSIGRASTQNTAIGDSALGGASNTTGNVGIGYKALSKQVNQGYNTAIGYFSQRDSSVNTFYNSSIGAYSMEYNRSGIYNTGLGLSAMRNSDSSSYNTAVGADAMYFHRGVNGSNTALGSFASRGDSIGYWNTAVGSEAMDRFGADGTKRGSGFSNVAVGFRALRQVREGFENTALGVGALEVDSSGNFNTAVGRYSGFLNKRGDYNVSMGYQSANDADTASAVVAIGSLALLRNKSDSNVAVGYRAARSLGFSTAWAPTEATMIGTWAGDAAFVSSKNTAVGFRALSQRNQVGGGTDYNGGGRNTAIGDSSMAWSVGISNVAIGAQAMPTGGVGIHNNVAIGDSALGGASLVNDNVAIGYHSLKSSNYAVSSNTGNIAIGAYAGEKITSGYYNTINGYYAMENSTTAAGVVAIGTSSFRNNLSGFDNVGVGINTGFYVTSGANTFTGSYAGVGASGLSTGGSNTANGYYALNAIRSGNFNTAVGRQALTADTSGSYNTAVGTFALRNNQESDFNTAVGYNSLTLHKRAGFTYNTGLGSFALEQDSIGYYNTGVGTSAFRFNKTGHYNTGVGINAGYYQKESFNTYVGGYAGFGDRFPGNNYAVDTGSYNTGIGVYSMYRIANGTNNVALGYSSLYSDSTGNLNTAVGNGALYSNVASNVNQAFGWNALYNYEGIGNGWNNAFGDRAAESLQTGTQNVMMGSWAFLNHTSGAFNTAVGNYVMGNGTGGNNNTALGSTALFNTNADANTGIGIGAGSINISGTNNTFVGAFSNATLNNLTNATAIGYNAQVSANNSLVLGQSGTNVGINESSPNARLHIVRTGTSGGTYHASSSAIIEDNASSYLQFSNPNANETGLLSGNAVTTIRSGMIFRADSSVQLRAGGNVNRMHIDNSGNVGINTTTPAALLEVNGTAIIGASGTTLNAIIRSTQADDLPSIAAGATTTRTYAIANTIIGASVYVSPANGLLAGLVIGYARVSSAGNVTVSFTNTTGGALDQTNQNYYITVIQ